MHMHGSAMTVDQFRCPRRLNTWRKAMNIILSMLIGLSVVVGIVAPASALDAQNFYDQMDRTKF
jgi:hypothetical protein